jgi:predicted RNase H-like HicB family nuclease
MDYLVIFEKGNQGYGAYVPDLPGCVAAGETLDEVRELIREAVPLHLELMREQGEPIPAPTSVADVVRVA